ncbi:hypothetical protein V1511DRAFT_457332 [Dipodascopsis uninucleata]
MEASFYDTKDSSLSIIPSVLSDIDEESQSTTSSTSSSDITNLSSLPEILQRKLDLRRDQVTREIEAFRDRKLREFDIYQNELLRSFAHQQLRAVTIKGRPTFKLPPSALRPSSLKGANGVKRSGDKKKVMFILSQEIPPVSPGTDIILATESSDGGYFDLPVRMSDLSVTSAIDEEPDEEMIEDTSIETTKLGSNDHSNAAGTIVTQRTTNNLKEIRQQFHDISIVPTSVHAEYTDSGLVDSPSSKVSPKPRPTIIAKFESSDKMDTRDSDSDYMFELDENLNDSDSVGSTWNGSRRFRSVSYSDRHEFGSQDNSLTNTELDSRSAMSKSLPSTGDKYSKWIGNNASFQVSKNSFKKTGDLSENDISNPSSLDEDIETNDTYFNDTVEIQTASNYGSSLPIEINSRGGFNSFAAKERNIHDDSGEMGVRGGVLVDDDEFQIESIKSIDNPDNLSFSRRFMWEQHVGSRPR